MIELADRMHRIGPSATAVAMARAADAKAAGHPVISLTTGEPDFDTPPHIQEAAIQAMRDGQTRYTAIDGTPELKDAIRAKFARENGLAYAADEVIASTGAKQVIFNALMALIGAGDEVIIPTPAWVSYVDIVRLAGGTPVILSCGPETGFRPDAAAIAALITPRTKALMLNAPSNPTGAMLDKTALKAIGEVLAPHNILTICDDIYEHLRYDGRDFHTLAQVCPELADRVLTVNGVSKAYAMTGWRLGYAGGPRDLIQAMKTLQSQSTTNPNAIAQAASAAALNGGLETVVGMRAAFERRRNMLCDRLSGIPGLQVHRPEGAFYLFIGIEQLLGGNIADEDTFVAALLDKANLGVVGGAGFGLSPYFRISFAAADEELSTAANRLEAFVTSL
ncbi:pyridoxal phosphate-dependent aminotransferase [Halovulum sp. GXIMD14793]